MTRVGLVIVSHSARLAEGVVELAAQMATGVAFRAAGGTADGRLGTSLEKVLTAVEELLEAGHEVAVLTDLGSAAMTAEAVLELLADDRVRLAPGPLVEGAVAAAVTAQIGGGLSEVVNAARAHDAFPDPPVSPE